MDAQQVSNDEWKQKLTPEQYHILREGGTELPGTGKLLHNDATGEYRCAACNTLLFTSNDKYESDLPGLEGWPSFAAAAAGGAVELKPDNSLGMARTEVICKTCGSHLGHLFDDPSSPTNEHFCINSAALEFMPKEDTPKDESKEK
jgi:peptide-methionine (R)-S-oxide reductase